MPTSVTLDLDGTLLEGELNDTPAAAELAGHLPLIVRMQRWGDTYQGSMPVTLNPPGEPETDVLDVGELAYYRPTNALCLFFGHTPASVGDESRAAGPVYRIGRVAGNWDLVKGLRQSLTAALDRF
jgi:hypothetical protein